MNAKQGGKSTIAAIIRRAVIDGIGNVDDPATVGQQVIAWAEDNGHQLTDWQKRIIGDQFDTTVRFVVIGQMRQIEEWRLDHGLPKKRIIAAVQHSQALFGIAGPLVVVWLETFEFIHGSVIDGIRQQINTLTARGAVLNHHYQEEQ